MAGRKRSPLEGGTVAREFAQRLRDLRDGSGMTLREMALKSGYSQGALSMAESGRKVPSWDIASVFVQTCGEDPRGWRQLWEVARREQETAAGSPSESGRDDDPASGRRTGPEEASATDASAEPDAIATPAGRAEPDPMAALAKDAGGERAAAPVTGPYARTPGRPGRGAALVAGGVVLAAAVVLGVVYLSGSHGPGGGGGDRSPAGRAAGMAAAKDGTDPYVDGCKADDKQLDWQPVRRSGGRPFGTLILMFSPACDAAWGYLNGPNSRAWTTHIIAHRSPGDATAPSRFSGDAAFGSWGNVMSTHTGCVYAEAYVVDSHGEGPHARTACFQPAAPATPRGR